MDRAYATANPDQITVIFPLAAPIRRIGMSRNTWRMNARYML